MDIPDSAAIMRQSLLGTFDICPRRAQYSLDPDLPYTTSEAAAKGTGYHRALQVYYGQRMAGHEFAIHATEAVDLYVREAVQEFRDEVDRAEDRMRWDTDQDTAEEALSGLVRRYFADARYWNPEATVLAVEHDFQAVWLPRLLLTPWTQAWYKRGTIDLVLELPLPIEGRPTTLVLVDHKTAGRKWKKNKDNAITLPQSAWYLDAWEEETGRRPDFFVFDIMTNSGWFDRRWIPGTHDANDATMERFHATARLIDLYTAAGIDWPTNPSSNLCSPRYCDHWERCPIGQQTRPA